MHFAFAHDTCDTAGYTHCKQYDKIYFHTLQKKLSKLFYQFLKLVYINLKVSAMYSGICAIRHLSFPIFCDIRQIIYDPKVFLLAKIKPEYYNILYNPTHFTI